MKKKLASLYPETLRLGLFLKVSPMLVNVCTSFRIVSEYGESCIRIKKKNKINVLTKIFCMYALIYLHFKNIKI